MPKDNTNQELQRVNLSTKPIVNDVTQSEPVLLSKRSPVSLTPSQAALGIKPTAKQTQTLSPHTVKATANSKIANAPGTNSTRSGTGVYGKIDAFLSEIEQIAATADDHLRKRRRLLEEETAEAEAQVCVIIMSRVFLECFLYCV